MSVLTQNRGTVREILAWIAYPVTMALAFSSFLFTRSLGASPQSSAYVAAIVTAAAVTWLEHANPHLQDWRGRWQDVRSDLIYMIVVQALLPAFLGITLSIAFLHALERRGLDPVALWPHDWPGAAQVVLMLLVADFLRYWLHVAAHRHPVLWRLHAVHHSPDRLYWLNVGRFHPIEKALQYLLDALPFILLGVGADVLALYLVFYAANGFFQHSNIELRFGLLNYVISSAELHRWHHSRVPAESNHNYGNNLIVWDLLFGTRFLPREREIRDLGLPNHRYPMAFGAQMKTPLIRDIEQRELPELRWSEIGLNMLIWMRMTRVWLVDVHRLFRAAARPKRVQSRLLERIIADNRDAEFGKEHAFAEIQSIADYRERVPVQEYEDLRPYIETQERDGSPQLTSKAPVLYTRTSGTTDKPKFVPVLASTLADLRQAQSLFASIQFHEVPGAYYGRYLAIVSPAIEGWMPSGKPYGAASGHIYRSIPRPARAKYLLPWQLFEIEDYDLRYLLIVRLALVEKNITHMASANPSTFLKLADTLESHRADLLADIRDQRFLRANELSGKVREALHGRWSCPAERIAELEILLADEAPTFAALWPFLELVTTWTSGSCRTALSALRPLLPPATLIADPGYVSSEFRGSITIDIGRRLALPTLTENFFEFVEVSDWDRGEPVFLCLDELVEGRNYYVIVTTRSGLYRYFINDIVTVTGRFRATPTIEFVQKGNGVTNITGEKLYEGQAIEAVNSAAEHCGVPLAFFVMLADVDSSRYRLFVEPCEPLRALDESFCASVEGTLATINIEYKEKRASGRLRPLECRRLRCGAREAFKRSRLDAGQREGQYKETALAYSSDIDFHYAEYCDPPG
jgi:sterol desaturase/sphingolipid hydroxylase (fatty acid hydroxylase superfamily)